jgi:ferredoxin--NADP+ reductase
LLATRTPIEWSSRPEQPETEGLGLKVPGERRSALNKIVEHRELAEGSHFFVLDAPEIARKARPGQFVILLVDDRGERIPITIADSDPGRGTIKLLIQAVGKSTHQMGQLGVGDEFLAVVGPLGQPSPIEDYGRVVCLGGGFGIAALHPVAKGLKAVGNHVTSIIGARRKDLLIMEEEMRGASTELLISTDDGSYGFHGFVTDVLAKLIAEGGSIDIVFGIGPVPMMRAVALMTRAAGIRTISSLNPIMVDGTGMCGVCRCRVGGETKFACVDGPDFDAHEVDWDELVARQRAYLDQEKRALQKYLAQRGGGANG